MANIADLLSQSADLRPDHVAVKVDESQLTYAELDRAAARVAGLLRDEGVLPGDRVGIMLPNVPHFALATTARCGREASSLPMNVLLKQREVAFYLATPGPSSLSRGPAFAAEPRTPARRRRERSACSSSPASSSTLLGAATAAAKSSIATATTPPSSSTPRARPASPRAPSSPTST